MLPGTLSSLASLHEPVLPQSLTASLVGLPIGLGAISGIITGKTSRSNWYTASHGEQTTKASFVLMISQTMSPPPGNPPRQVFGPVNLCVSQTSELDAECVLGLDHPVRPDGVRFASGCPIIRFGLDPTGNVRVSLPWLCEYWVKS